MRHTTNVKCEPGTRGGMMAWVASKRASSRDSRHMILMLAIWRSVGKWKGGCISVCAVRREQARGNALATAGRY
jgi:hypothetical protein